MRCRGLSFVETLVGMFLLTSAGFACMTLMLRASRIQTQTMLGVEATRVAQSCQNSVRLWGENLGNFVSGSLYNDLSVSAPEWNGLEARIRMSASPQTILSPTTSMENSFAAAQRQLQQTLRPFSVEVRWGASSQQAVALYASLATPLHTVRATSPVRFTRVSGSASPMAAEALASYQVSLLNSSNQEIPGVTFRWQVLPEFVPSSTAGLGSLDQSLDRSGHRVWLIHHYYAGDPDVPSVPGWVRLRAQCRYGGTVYVYDTDPILLQ